MEKLEILKSKGVKVDDALEFWGDESSYSDSLKEFRDSLDSRLKELEGYKDSKDFENYGILAHSIKSECKYLGFMDQADVFLEHEQAGKNSDEKFINYHFKDLEKTCDELKSIIDKYFGGDEKKPDKKILLVADDSNIMINYIEKNIPDEFIIIRANNGRDAITYLGNSKIYAMLLDLNMPSVNGFQVLDYMQDNNMLEKIPVVIITGDNSEDTIKKAFTYPILDVLNKPFNSDNITRVLTSIDSFYN